MESARQALQAWIAALNAQGAEATTRAACEPTVEIHRYNPLQTTAASVYQGWDMVEAWVRRVPVTNKFELVDGTLHALTDRDGWFECKYCVRVDAWSNQGTWRFSASDAGKLVALHHHPEPLKDDM